MNRALWIVQGLLAPLFLFTGTVKLVMPLGELVAMTGLPGPLIIFTAISELLGALGLILPGLTRIRMGLTPLAAGGLTIIMVGATVLTAIGVGGSDPNTAIVPLVVGILTAFVAYGRWQLAPRQRGLRQAAPQPAC